MSDPTPKRRIPFWLTLSIMANLLLVGLVAGVMLQAINPKAYAVNTTLFTGFAYAPDSLLFETASKLVIFNLFWIPIHLGWLWAGVALERLNLGARHQFHVNVVMALAMLGVVILALWTGFGGAR